jgi:Fe-Mn family superoxide dismutase
MSFTEQSLPYDNNHLKPVISAETIDFHFGKHQAAYAAKLTELTKDTPFENMDLISIIKETYGNAEKTAVYNNAAQLWNHIFYWEGLKAEKANNTLPDGDFKQLVVATFGSEDNMKEELIKAAVSIFGSGWAWLAFDKKNNVLKIVKSQNADNPLVMDMIPLFTIDVWEHAYYIDYRNRRADYARNLVYELADWNTVQARYIAALK